MQRDSRLRLETGIIDAERGASETENRLKSRGHLYPY